MKYINDEVKSNNKIEEIMLFVSLAHNRANNLLKSFFDKIDLDYSLFNHLYNIEIIIDNSTKTAYDDIVAYYTHKNEFLEPEIYICAKYVDELICYYKKSNKNNNIKNEIIDQLSRTIIHELIHANRCIIINDTININDSLLDNREEKEYNKFNDLLDYLLSNNLVSLEKRKTIINIVKNNNYMIVNVYNKKKDQFEEYRVDNLEFINKSNSYIKRYLEYIINYNDKILIPNRIISKETKSDSYMCLDYNLSNNTYCDSIIDRGFIINKISKQVGFEEAITEAMSGIILESNKYMNLNLKTICNKLIMNNDENEDTILIYRIIKKYGISFIKWFILSSYMDSYYNELENIFDDDYEEIIDLFYYCIEDDTDYLSDVKKILKKRNI